MEFAPPDLSITKLRRKMDISRLTLHVAAENVFKRGRFYLLWRDGNFIVIQAEPWWRPDVDPDVTLSMSCYLEEHRALWQIQEVIQTMLDTIVFDDENNWAYLVRRKDNTYHLVYRKRRLISKCPIWTKVVELDDIELTRFMNGMCWEGIYNGRDVDIFIGWQDDWAAYVSAESEGQKLIQSMGLGQYFFDLEAHISKNGVIVGIMMEALVGRCVTPTDRSAVFEAIADIQRHGICILFQICDIYITERGVRFAGASSARHFRDPDTLAEEAQFMWKTLADIFDHMDDDPLRGRLSGSRSMGSKAFVIPPLPSPARPMALMPEEAIIRWIWSVTMSNDFCKLSSYHAFIKLHSLRSSRRHVACHKRAEDDRRTLLPPDESSSDLGSSVGGAESLDGPLVVKRGLTVRWHPYARPESKRLLLPERFD